MYATFRAIHLNKSVTREYWLIISIMDVWLIGSFYILQLAATRNHGSLRSSFYANWLPSGIRIKYHLVGHFILKPVSKSTLEVLNNQTELQENVSNLYSILCLWIPVGTRTSADDHA